MKSLWCNLPLLPLLPRQEGSFNAPITKEVDAFTQFSSGAGMALEAVTETMETVVANLSGGNMRRESVNNRDFLVAPLSLIVPGVLDGSKGPLLYRLEDLKHNVSAWNGIPLTVDHPSVDGMFVSSKYPGVLDKVGIGHVQNAKINDKLVAEGWFDLEKTKRVEPRIINALENGRPVELSTGVFTDNEKAKPGATHNGRSYWAVAKNFQPDHVAILPDKVGACSVNDGCGVIVNEGTEKGMFEFFRNIFSQLNNQQVDNEQSHTSIRMNLSRLLDKRFGMDPETFVVDVFDDSVIYRRNDTLYRLPYTVDGETIVLSDEAPVEVQRVVSFEPVSNEDQSKMSKKEMVDGLIANCDCWTEEDRETLNSFTEEKLKKLQAPIEKAKKEEAVANAARQGFQDQQGDRHFFNEEFGKWEVKKEATNNEGRETKEGDEKNNGKPHKEPMTANEWLDSAPPEIRSVFENAMKTEQKEKDGIIDKLTSNLEGDKKKAAVERLKNRSLQSLREDAELFDAIQPARKPQASAQQFRGAAAPPPTGNTGSQVANEQDEVLPVPTIDWAENAKQV